MQKERTSKTELTSASTLKANRHLSSRAFVVQTLTNALTASMDVATAKQPENVSG